MSRFRYPPASGLSPMDPRWPVDHLEGRLQRCNQSYLDSWPKWNNEDFSAVTQVINELNDLRRKLSERNEEPSIDGEE